MPARMIHETPTDLWAFADPRKITPLDPVADWIEDGATDREAVTSVMKLVSRGSVRLLDQVGERELLTQ